MPAKRRLALVRVATALTILCASSGAAFAQENGPVATGAGVSIAFQNAAPPIASTGQGVSIAFQSASPPIASTGRGVSIAFQTASSASASTGQGVSIAFQTAAPTAAQTTGGGVSIAFQQSGGTSAGAGVTVGFGSADTTPPETTITNGPAHESTVFTRSVALAWTGADDQSGPLTFSYRLDGGDFSPFSASTSVTLTDLSLGDHTFEVRARDSSGNVDPTAAIRRFQVQGWSFIFDVSTGGISFAEGLTVPFAAYVFDAADASTPLTSAAVGVRLSVVGPTAETVFGPSLLAFNPANRQFTGSMATSGHALGTYHATFTFLDSAGGVIGSESRSFELLGSFAISIRSDREKYRRAQAVELAGALTDENGAPLALTPLTLSVSSRGFVREFTTLTNAQGLYQFIFNPLSTEAGIYVARARATRNGLTKDAQTSFEIHGLLLEPGVTTVEMSTNSWQAVPLRLRNIGETALSDVTLQVQDGAPADGATATLTLGALEGLAPGATQELILNVNIPVGAPSPEPLVFTVVATSAEGVSETATVRVTPREARGLPVVEPATVRVGMKPGTSRSLAFTLRNEGFGPLTDGRVEVQDAATFNWVIVEAPILGLVEPGASKAFGVVLAPGANVTLGTHLVRIDVRTATETIPVLITVDVTTSDVRPVSVLVADDTGADVGGALVSLTSASFETSYQGSTDSTGRVAFAEVPAGKYTLRIAGDKHAPYTAEVIIEAGAESQPIEAILSTKVVDFSFKVTRTSIADQYDVSLVVTYSTELIKPALVVMPSRLDFSFDRGQSATGEIVITNSHTQASVTDVLVDASMLDASFGDFKLALGGTTASTQLIAELGPGQTIRIPYMATLLGPDADLTTRDLGTIAVSGKYVFSLRGEARIGTTESAVFARFRKPDGLRLQPPLAFLNDETDGIACNLPYQGTTTIIDLINFRPFALDILGAGGRPAASPAVRALSVAIPETIGLDAVPLSLLEGAPTFWTGQVAAGRLNGNGGRTFFDITGLQAGLEQNCAAVVNGPLYAAVVAQWEDATEPQGILFPISIITVRQGSVSIHQGGGIGSGGGGSGGGSATGRSFNNHGIVKIQIDQKVSLEREAFNATLDVLAAVPVVGLTAALDIRDSEGRDASDKFVISQTQAAPAVIDSQAQLGWLIVPKVVAGGTDAAGRTYTITAAIGYSVNGVPATFVTAPETFTVQPLPRLRLDYTIPYVVMGDIPFNLEVKVSNIGAGAAHGVTIQSAQPRIIENPSNLPISFGIDGTAATADGSDFQSGSTTIPFGTIAPAASKTGFWQMHATRRGFFIDFASTLSHRTVNGKVLDPLIEQVNLHFQPAVGGSLGVVGCNLGPLSVTLTAGGTTLLPVLGPGGSYYFPKVPPGSRLDSPLAGYVATLSLRGQPLLVVPVDVLSDQPTDFVDLIGDTRTLDIDRDGMHDCWELKNGLNPNDDSDAHDDSDGDGLTSLGEHEHGTNPRNADTDDDGFSDGTEVRLERNPLDQSDFPGLRAEITAANRLVVLNWDPTPDPVLNYQVHVCRVTPEGCVENVSTTVHADASHLTYVGVNDQVYRFTVFAIREGSQRMLWTPVFARPGAFAGAFRPPRPLVFVHGICFADVPFFSASADSWKTVTNVLRDTLNWDFGGTLSHREGEPLTSGFDASLDFFTVTFNNCRGNPGGIAQQAIELEQFTSLIGGSRPFTFVAHSMGGLVARRFTVDNPSIVTSLVTYGTPHWGVQLGDAVVGSAGARDTDYRCPLFPARLDYSDNPFLETLRTRPLPSHVRTTAIGGRSTLGFLVPALHTGCLGPLHDGLIELASTALRTPAQAPLDQVQIAPPSYREIVTRRNHINQTNDVSPILCALNDKCLIARVFSPVDLEITAPDGRVQSKDFASIPGASYIQFGEHDEDAPSTVIIPLIIDGEYQIRLVPKSGALPTDTYSLIVTEGDETRIHVENQQIRDIPPDGFTVAVVTETGTNRAPIANAGSAQGVQAISPAGAPVILNGSGSSDPDADQLTFAWSGPFGTTVGERVTVTLPLGVHSITLTVADGRGGTATASVAITVMDTAPPRVVPPTSVTVVATGVAGAQAGGSPSLSAFLSGSTATDAVDAAPLRLPVLLGGLQVDDNTLFPIGVTTVTFRFRDASGNIGTATANVTVLPQQQRLVGSGYTFPESSQYRATFSMNIVGPGAPAGSLQYYYSRTRMNFVSTSVTAMVVAGASVTISGAGTVNGVAGYTYTVTSELGSPDRFGIVIRRPDGSTFYSAPLKNLAGGDLTIQ